MVTSLYWLDLKRVPSAGSPSEARYFSSAPFLQKPLKAPPTSWILFLQLLGA
jgi:hypothetical protein